MLQIVKTWLIVIIVSSILVNCSSRQRLPSQPTPPLTESDFSSREYHVQIGDEIDVFVIEDSSFNGPFVVRPSGDIIMPKVGRILIQGMSLKEAESRIKQALESNQLRSATVIVDPGRRGESGGGLTVRISGEVGQTGRVTIKPLGNTPVTAYQAVIDSGGFKAFANKRRSYILRTGVHGVVRIDIDFEAVEGGKAQDAPVMEGDCIVVPKKMFGL